MRRAMVCQLGMRNLQQAAGGGDDFRCGYLQQSRIRRAGVRERSLTGTISQDDVLGPVRAVAYGIGGAEYCDDWNLQRRGKMKRAGITSDEEARPASKRDEL